jgi:PleD family two-component response regulator
VRASIGVATDAPGTVAQRADAALYDAKQAKRGPRPTATQHPT